MSRTGKILFSPGQLVATPGVLEHSASGALLFDFLMRHVTGDWGDLDDQDKRANNLALIGSGRILSAYTLPNGVKFWIITEWDRSFTTFLLPEEY